MGRALAHIQQQWHINHGQEIYCVKLASSVSMLDADRVCSSDRGVVSHLSMPPLVLTACASNLFWWVFFFFLPLLLPFLQSLFCKIKTLPSPQVENRKLGLPHQHTNLFPPCMVGSLLSGGKRKGRASLPTPKAAQSPFREREGKMIGNRCKFRLCLVQAICLLRVTGTGHQDEISVNITGKM